MVWFRCTPNLTQYPVFHHSNRILILTHLLYFVEQLNVNNTDLYTWIGSVMLKVIFDVKHGGHDAFPIVTYCDYSAMLVQPRYA